MGETKMTTLLQKAISEVSALNETEQDQFARWILAELDDEHRWDEQFASSMDVLEELAAEARAEYRSGKTQPLDPDKL
jgi:hypothetical protein